mgnify:CR=1 FL=1
MTTYMLPTAGWAVLLPGIVQSARPGSTLVVGTVEMCARALEALRSASREDVAVKLDPDLAERFV